MMQVEGTIVVEGLFHDSSCSSGIEDRNGLVQRWKLWTFWRGRFNYL